MFKSVRIAAVLLTVSLLWAGSAAMGDTLTWVGGAGNWSDPANWSSDGANATPQTGDSVVIGDSAADRVIVQDIAALTLSNLSVTQSTAGVKQTLQLNGSLTVDDADKTTLPEFNITGGEFLMDIGSSGFTWDAAGIGNHTGNLPLVIASGMTVQLDGGSIGTNSSQTTLKVASGGKLAGVGTVYGSRGASWGGFLGFQLDAGAELEVGDGLLFFDDGGNQFQLYGSITGTAAGSALWLGQHQASLSNMSTGSGLSVGGLSHIRMSGTPVLGRFADASQFDLAGTTVELYRPGSLTMEAQATIDDLAGFKVGALEWSGTFSGYDVVIRLRDTGSIEDDFFYAGQLVGMNADQLLDLQDVALLTDMTETELTALLPYVFNSVDGGAAPAVKSVNLSGSTYWYLAPEDISIVPEPGTVALLALGAGGWLLRRRRA